MEVVQRVTELPNSLTEDIDVASAEEICRLLRQVDSQIFTGWKEYAGTARTYSVQDRSEFMRSACFHQACWTNVI